MNNDNKIVCQNKDKTMRIIKYYNTFFAHPAYKLQKFVTFLCFAWWETIENDSLGIHCNGWANYYNLDYVK